MPPFIPWLKEEFILLRTLFASPNPNPSPSTRPFAPFKGSVKLSHLGWVLQCPAQIPQAPLKHAATALRQPRSLLQNPTSLYSIYQLQQADLEESTLDSLFVKTAPHLMKIHIERVCKDQARLILSRGASTMSTLICFLIAWSSLCWQPYASQRSAVLQILTDMEIGSLKHPENTQQVLVLLLALRRISQ